MVWRRQMLNSDKNGSYLQYSMRDFFNILFRHKKKIIFFFLAATITVTLGTLLATQIYRTDAKLMMLIGRETVTLDPTATTGQVIPMSQSRTLEMNAELEILKSQELAEKVVDTFGPKAILEGSLGGSGGRPLTFIQEMLRISSDLLKEALKRLRNFLVSLGISIPLSERDQAIMEFQKNFNVETQRDNNILFLSYEGPEDRLPQSVLTRVVNLFLEKHIIAHRTSGSY
jgi:uncharacterized protein involved in exopolysaccharide biosynthesis